MGNLRTAPELSRTLYELKVRSRLSYAGLARKVFISTSALHRYCTGAAVPSDYDLVMRIAKECGASDVELTELLGLWTALTAPEELDEDLTERIPRGRRRRWWSLVLAAVCLAALFVALRPGTPQSAKQTVSSWETAPQSLPRELFGVTMNSSTGKMPSFRVGSVRLWDSQTRWANLEPRQAQFDWTILDRLVAGANQAGLPVLFVIGGTPQWAAPDAPRMAYDDGSRAALPDDLAHWDAFVNALARRYRGRIEAYELWVMGNDSRYYNGGVERLVDASSRASRIIKGIDPKARIVCPGMGQLWKDEALQGMRRFAELHGYDHCDAASVKLHQRSAAEPPETMLDLLERIDRTFHQANVHPSVWSTGTTYEILLENPLDAERARAYAVRYFLVGLYGRRLNLRRMYFYNWGGSRIPLVLQPEGGAPTAAALAVEQLQNWLDHAELSACGHGLAVNRPENVWQCQFSMIDASGRHDATLIWTDKGTADVVTGPGQITVHQLDGATTQADPGGTTRVSELPVLLEHR